MRTIVSSWAFVAGLQSRNGKIIQIDPDKNIDVKQFQNICKESNIDSVFYNESDLTCPIEKTDLLFIDTWHVYGQLKRELGRWYPHVSKYIIMHDTTVDAVFGESIRCNLDIKTQSTETGIPIDEINKGLEKAIIEFLNVHTEWKIKEKFENNNGLTILERIN